MAATPPPEPLDLTSPEGQERALAAAKEHYASHIGLRDTEPAAPPTFEEVLNRLDAVIRRMALKSGVAAADLEPAMRAFASYLTPHSGRPPSLRSPKHYRGWWRGYAAGLRAGRAASPAT